MSENYIVINGKRVELTPEQVKALGIETRKNPFERVNDDDTYYYIMANGDVSSHIDINDSADKIVYDALNYFNDKRFANQVTLHQLLYRKLLKFAYDNNCEDTAEWDCCNRHFRIYYTYSCKNFDVDSNDTFKIQGAVYFATRESAEQAIKEVVKPFMKEHPDFVW